MSPPHAGSALALVLCLLGTAAPAAQEAATPWSLARLMMALSAVSSAEARFTERKYIDMLDQPLVLEGTLRYRAPDFLEKRVTAPQAQRYEVDGDRLVIESAQAGRRVLSLEDHPLIRAFVESYRATLAGDVEGLREHYRPTLEGTRERWELRLEPRSAALAEHVSAVVVRGKDGKIESVETLEAGGDRSVLVIDGEATR